MRELVHHAIFLRNCFYLLMPAILLTALSPMALAKSADPATQTLPHSSLTAMEKAGRADGSPTGSGGLNASRKLIVIGFMGGHIRADDFVHKEAQVARDLQQQFPGAV